MFLEMAAADYAKTNISQQNRQADISNACSPAAHHLPVACLDSPSAFAFVQGLRGKRALRSGALDTCISPANGSPSSSTR